MARTLFLLTLLSYWSGTASQPTLTQTPSQSVAPDQTVKFSCTVSSNKNTVCWVQQRSRQSPRFIQCAGYSRGDGIPDRFTASDSGNVGSLTITNTQPEDEADYYCYMWYSSGSQWVFGGGTTLTISGQPTVAPKVHLFPPSKEELESKSKATLVCLLQEFSPAAFQVTWVADGTDISNGVETTKATKVNDKYVASSYLTVSASDWKSHESFSCKVTHEGSHFVKSVSHSQCP